MAEPTTRTRSLREQGLQALREGDDTHAIDLLTRAVLADDRDAEARACLGIAYSRKGLHPQALRLLQETVGLAPESPNFRFNLGVALDRAGQPEAAREAFLEVLRLAPDHPQAQQRLQSLPLPPADPPQEPEPVALAEEEPVALPVTLVEEDAGITATHLPARDPFAEPLPPLAPTPAVLQPLAAAARPLPGALDLERPYGYARHRARTIGALGVTGYLLLPVGIGCGLFGVASLALGISAWSMGNRDLAQMDAGEMDPSGRKSTARGRTGGIVLTFLALLDILIFLVLLVALLASGKLPGMGAH